MNIATWSLAFAVLGQIIGFSFWMGKLSQQVNDLKTAFQAEGIKTTDYRKNEREQTTANFKDSREQTTANFKDERDLLLKQAHQVLPECQISFTNLTAGLSELKGKIDMLILLTNNKNK
jgi:hypothetical protein